MKRIFTTLSSLLVIMGLKAQTPVQVKKETAPQVKPAAVDPKLKPVIKNETSIKYGVADSMKEAGIKHEGVKTATIKESTIKSGVIKNSTIKDVPIKDPNIKEATIKEGAIKQAHIKK